MPTDEDRGKNDRGDEGHDGTGDPDAAETGARGAASDVGQPGDPAEAEITEGDIADTAAASALARARAAARSRGLRPGSRPPRKRTASRSGISGGSETDCRDGRDPSLLGDQMDRLLLDRGWNVDVAIGSVMGRWPEIVGAEVAKHCTPVTFTAGVLVVRAESTAWATQLRLMSSSILGRLATEVGKDAVTELRVQGPSSPSWTRGPRKSTGPGPRDTYG